MQKKVLNELRKYASNSKWKRSSSLAAKQERDYWLVKRAVTGWIDQTHKLSQKNDLYKLLRTHYEFSLRKRTFTKFSNIIRFLQEQRYNDLLVVDQIVKMRQKNILAKWQKAKTKQAAVKILTLHSENILKAVVFRRIHARTQYQSCVISYMHSRVPYYQTLTAFNRLKFSLKRKRNFQYAHHSVHSRKDFWRVKKIFAQWQRIFTSIESNKQTRIQISFNKLKRYAQIKRYNRMSVEYYNRKLKVKMLNTVYNKSSIVRRDDEVTHFIQSKQIYTTKCRVLSDWRKLYISVSSERKIVESHTHKHQNLLLQKIIIEWRSCTAKKIKIHELSNQFKRSVDEARVQRGFDSFINGINHLRKMNSNHYKAQMYHTAKTKSLFLTAWNRRRLDNRVETRKIMRIRKMLNIKTIAKCWAFMLDKSHDKRMKIRMFK